MFHDMNDEVQEPVVCLREVEVDCADRVPVSFHVGMRPEGHGINAEKTLAKAPTRVTRL